MVQFGEADTCRKFIVPLLQRAGWDNEPHSIAEQRTITDGQIIPVGKGFIRKPPKRVDYLLRYTRDFPIAVVEAKAPYKSALDGVQQAKTYPEMLGLKFAYATNGQEIIEIDYTSGLERTASAYSTPGELWHRYRAARGLDAAPAERLLTPSNHSVGKTERYYQQIAINSAVEAILKGRKRLLITMATGTGKTVVAFQVCWKLWNARWNRTGDHRKPRILYLARNILVDQPKDGIFAAFGDARHKIESGEIIKSREMYFAIYQALAEDERRLGLFKSYPPDFFDLVIVDECHRGSPRRQLMARDPGIFRALLSAWHDRYAATQGQPRQLPVFRQPDLPVQPAAGNQRRFPRAVPGAPGDYRMGRRRMAAEPGTARPLWAPIPDGEYQTRDFERTVALRARTQAIARHLTEFLKKADRFDKTIVFCVDQDHAAEMRTALNNLNADLVAQHPDYVCRVTADEGDALLPAILDRAFRGELTGAS